MWCTSRAPLLFLLYINDLPGSSKKLTFTIFADDTNMFYSLKDPEQLQSVINEELAKVLKFCAANILSINFKNTNYMIITSPKKKTNIRITACRNLKLGELFTLSSGSASLADLVIQQSFLWVVLHVGILFHFTKNLKYVMQCYQSLKRIHKN